MPMSAKDETEIEGRGRFARKRATKDGPRERSLRPLGMVYRAGANYPGHVALALVALFITAAATLAIPAGFKLVIDRGFAAGADPADMGRWFRYLLMIVGVLAMGTAMRFYFVSWLGERVVADIRLRVQENLLRLAPGFYEENSPKEISSRMTSDTALIEQVVGTTVSVALRNALMAIGGALRLRRWIPRRAECGTPCQLCRVECQYGAIEKTGQVVYSECFQCLDCVKIHDDPAQCVPLVLKARDRKRAA